jgi:hypothetical protein
MNSGSPFKHWLSRLLKLYAMIFLSCVIAFPIALYLIVPFIGWLTANVPYTWPSNETIMKSVRYGITVTIWAGTVSWLSEFLPWLIKVLRSRR